LPTATSAQPNTKPDFIIVSVDALGDFYFEKEKIPKEEVLSHFQQLYNQNHEVRIYIRADKQAVYEGVMYVLDEARTSGIQKVGLEIKAQDAVQGGNPPGGAPPAGGAKPGP
jgi:biopolymer transport protein ExbD